VSFASFQLCHCALPALAQRRAGPVQSASFLLVSTSAAPAIGRVSVRLLCGYRAPQQSCCGLGISTTAAAVCARKLAGYRLEIARAPALASASAISGTGELRDSRELGRTQRRCLFGDPTTLLPAIASALVTVWLPPRAAFRAERAPVTRVSHALGRPCVWPRSLLWWSRGCRRLRAACAVGSAAWQVDGSLLAKTSCAGSL
jgi:hypothetical protein